MGIASNLIGGIWKQFEEEGHRVLHTIGRGRDKVDCGELDIGWGMVKWKWIITVEYVNQAVMSFAPNWNCWQSIESISINRSSTTCAYDQHFWSTFPRPWWSACSVARIVDLWLRLYLSFSGSLLDVYITFSRVKLVLIDGLFLNSENTLLLLTIFLLSRLSVHNWSFCLASYFTSIPPFEMSKILSDLVTQTL